MGNNSGSGSSMWDVNPMDVPDPARAAVKTLQQIQPGINLVLYRNTVTYSRLSRCCTARGSSIKVLPGGPSKVGPCEFCFIHYSSHVV